MSRGRWLILNYHEVSWEENIFLRPIGGTFPPDLFEEHVRCLRRSYDIVTPDEGRQRMLQGAAGRPMLTFWFDDGLRGVRRYALPILRRHGHRAALSINSALSLREQTFWRFELGFLATMHGPLAVRRHLNSRGAAIPRGAMLRDWTLRNFSDSVRDAIAEQFHQATSEDIRLACMSMYDGFEGFRELHEAGWTIANHSARHFPVSGAGQLNLLEPEFRECDTQLRNRLGIESPYWVLPFDYAADPGLDAEFDRLNADGRRVMVRVGNQANHPGNRPDRLWRITVPMVGGKELADRLASVA